MQENLKRAAPFAVAGKALGLPEGAIPVNNFSMDRYLGQWYEIARFDCRFEKGLQNVTAHYSRNPDGSVQVVNRGQDSFMEGKHLGRLKVSFFGPFDAAYTIIALDDDYRYALIAGNDLEYLWLFCRDYLQQATHIGYDVTRLILTNQDMAHA